jgi:outer membrane protein assembly factor BamA
LPSTEARRSPGRSFRLCALAVLLLLSGFAIAQTTHPKAANSSSPSSWKLTAVKVAGSQRYQASEVISATGLQIGQTVTEEDFQRASQRLGQTGAFDNVTYNFRYSSAGAQLELQVTDAGQWVPARFENFVWFPDQELRTTLHQQVPLFDGMLPLSGGLVDHVSDALQVLLLQRKIPGRADYLRAGPENGPINAIVFSVTGPNIRIRSVAFNGAGPGELPALNALGKQLAGREYSRSLLLIQASKNFLPVFLAHGYLKAAFAEAQAKVVDESTGDDNQERTNVDATFQIEPGRQYKLASLEWSGNKALSVDQLQPLVHLQAGQPANAVKLNADVEAIEKLYGTRGYVTVKVHPTPQFKETESTVSYRLEVREGDVYHMGEIEIQGLDDRDARQALAKWSLPKGDIYDSSYAKRFLDDAFKTALLDERWNVRVSEDPDLKEKTVDVTLRFSRKSS